MEEILESFKQSLERFREILGQEKTIANRDAAIKRFEFTAELAWKTIQKFLREQKITCRSPKECLEAAFQFGLVEDDPLWMEALEDRNKTVHTYDEKFVDEVYGRLPRYLGVFMSLSDKMPK